MWELGGKPAAALHLVLEFKNFLWIFCLVGELGHKPVIEQVADDKERAVAQGFSMWASVHHSLWVASAVLCSGALEENNHVANHRFL